MVIVIGCLSGVCSLHIDLILSPSDAPKATVSVPQRGVAQGTVTIRRPPSMARVGPSPGIRRPPALHIRSEQAQWRPSFLASRSCLSVARKCRRLRRRRRVMGRRRRGINQQRRPWVKAAATWQRERLRIHGHRHRSIITRTGALGRRRSHVDGSQ